MTSASRFFLLIASGLLFRETFDIDSFEMLVMGAAVWPRIVIGVLALLSATLLVQTLHRPSDDGPREPLRPLALIREYRNPLWCYALFAVYLLTIDFFGMLIGTILVVFGIMCAIGPKHPRTILVNAVIATVSVGLMWALFTFALKLYMPEGEILKLW